MEEIYGGFKGNKTVKLILFILKWIILGTISGVLTGVVVALFLLSLEWATTTREMNPWLLFLLPLGGAFVSFIYDKVGKNSYKGNNLIIDKINNKESSIPIRMIPLVFFGAVVTHLCGGSAGREGTGVQIGGGVSETLGKVMRLNKRDQRLLIMAGVSGGFGSIFGTPLAGTMFGLEIAAIGGMSYEALIVCFFASFAGYLTVDQFGVSRYKYNLIGNLGINPSNLLKVVLAAILFGIMSRVFSLSIYVLRKKACEWFKKSYIRSFVFGSIVIVLVYISGSREYLGLSLPLIHNAFKGDVNINSFIWKYLFTTITLVGGFQGGEVTPLFGMGATLGFTLAIILHAPVAIFVALGFIGVFNGATNTPITSFVLGIELFGSKYALYIFIVCMFSYLTSGHSGVYMAQRIRRYKDYDNRKEGLSLSEYRETGK